MEQPELGAAKEIKTDAAKELAAWFSVCNDLEKVSSWLEELIKLIDSGETASLQTESLWTSALIYYARCFVTGFRVRLSADIHKDLEGEPLEVHQWFMDMRNKRVAHPVNNYEQYRTGAVKNKEIQGVFVGQASFVNPDRKGCADFLALTRNALNFANDKYNVLNAEVLEYVKKMSVEEVDKLEKLEFKILGPQTAAEKFVP